MFRFLSSDDAMSTPSLQKSSDGDEAESAEAIRSTPPRVQWSSSTITHPSNHSTASPNVSPVVSSLGSPADSRRSAQSPEVVNSATIDTAQWVSASAERSFESPGISSTNSVAAGSYASRQSRVGPRSAPPKVNGGACGSSSEMDLTNAGLAEIIAAGTIETATTACVTTGMASMVSTRSPALTTPRSSRSVRRSSKRRSLLSLAREVRQSPRRDPRSDAHEPALSSAPASVRSSVQLADKLLLGELSPRPAATLSRPMPAQSLVQSSNTRAIARTNTSAVYNRYQYPRLNGNGTQLLSRRSDSRPLALAKHRLLNSRSGERLTVIEDSLQSDEPFVKELVQSLKENNLEVPSSLLLSEPGTRRVTAPAKLSSPLVRNWTSTEVETAIVTATPVSASPQAV